MFLKSSDFLDGQHILEKHSFNSFGCTGKNVVPFLTWDNFPNDTRSFALTIYDPDAPTGSGWWHWIVYNLHADIRNNEQILNAGNMQKLPGGICQAPNDFGNYNYCGPCPPEGDPPHRYIFTIHSLKIPSIDLPENATGAMARFMIYTNSLASAALTAKFNR